MGDLSGSAGLKRYRFLARGYDLTSGEPVYRVGRRIGVELLGLRPGDVVADLGCGTGLNFALLQQRIGPTGRVVAVDASPAMLAQAGARVRAAGWTNVTLVCADAQTLAADTVRAGGGVDAAIATYALSLMPRWRDAWTALLRCCRDEARVAVVDLRVPDAAPPGRGLARLAGRLGGADLEAHPWRALEADGADVTGGSAWAGHVQVRAGRVRGGGQLSSSPAADPPSR